MAVVYNNTSGCTYAISDWPCNRSAHYDTYEEKERRASELEAWAAFLDFIYAAMLVYSWLWYRTRRALCGRRPFWWLGAPPLGPPKNNSSFPS